MLKAIIIDNKWDSIEAFRNLLTNYCKEVNVLTTFTTIEESIKSIHNYRADVVFLEIMPVGKVENDFLAHLKEINLPFVFITTNKSYALKAFRYAALDILLKPIVIDDLKNTIKKIKDLKDKNNVQTRLENFIENYQPNTKEGSTQLALNSKNEIEFVNLDEIIFCEADGFYTRFHLENNRTVFVTKNLKEYEELLPNHFFRIHKSYLVNRNKVKKIIKTDGGSVLMSNGQNLPLSQRKKDLFLDFISTRSYS